MKHEGLALKLTHRTYRGNEHVRRHQNESWSFSSKFFDEFRNSVQITNKKKKLIHKQERKVLLTRWVPYDRYIRHQNDHLSGRMTDISVMSVLPCSRNSTPRLLKQLLQRSFQSILSLEQEKNSFWFLSFARRKPFFLFPVVLIDLAPNIFVRSKVFELGRRCIFVVGAAFWLWVFVWRPRRERLEWWWDRGWSGRRASEGLNTGKHRSGHGHSWLCWRSRHEQKLYNVFVTRPQCIMCITSLPVLAAKAGSKRKESQCFSVAAVKVKVHQLTVHSYPQSCSYTSHVWTTFTMLLWSIIHNKKEVQSEWNNTSLHVFSSFRHSVACFLPGWPGSTSVRVLWARLATRTSAPVRPHVRCSKILWST